MKTLHRAWPALLAGIVLSIALSIPAIGSSRYEKSLRANDGYGDFQTLFVSADDSTRVAKSSAVPVFDFAPQEKEPLAWAIREDRLPGAFTWLSLLLDQGSRTLLRTIESLAVTSLLPGGILLVATATICLIGIRRRDRSQA